MYTVSSILLHDVKYDIEQYLQQEKDSIFSEFGRDNYTTNTEIFSWWNYVIAMHCLLMYSDRCRQNLLITLRKYYQDNDNELRVLEDFERTYTPDPAIRWYTRDNSSIVSLIKHFGKKYTSDLFVCFLLKRHVR